MKETTNPAAGPSGFQIYHKQRLHFSKEKTRLFFWDVLYRSLLQAVLDVATLIHFVSSDSLKKSETITAFLLFFLHSGAHFVWSFGTYKIKLRKRENEDKAKKTLKIWGVLLRIYFAIWFMILAFAFWGLEARSNSTNDKGVSFGMFLMVYSLQERINETLLLKKGNFLFWALESTGGITFFVLLVAGFEETSFGDGALPTIFLLLSFLLLQNGFSYFHFKDPGNDPKEEKTSLKKIEEVERGETKAKLTNGAFDSSSQENNSKGLLNSKNNEKGQQSSLKEPEASIMKITEQIEVDNTSILSVLKKRQVLDDLAGLKRKKSSPSFFTPRDSARNLDKENPNFPINRKEPTQVQLNMMNFSETFEEIEAEASRFNRSKSMRQKKKRENFLAVQQFLAICPEGIMMISKKLEISFKNAAMFKIFGTKSTEELKKKLLNLCDFSKVSKRRFKRIEGLIYDSIRGKPIQLSERDMLMVSESVEGSSGLDIESGFKNKDSFSTHQLGDDLSKFSRRKIIMTSKEKMLTMNRTKKCLFSDTLKDIFEQMEIILSSKSSIEEEEKQPETFKHSTKIEKQEDLNPFETIPIVFFKTFIRTDAPEPRYKIIEIRITPILYSYTPMVALWISEITKNQALEKMSSELEYKTKVLANVSHEMRTPLHGISSFLAQASENLIKDKVDTNYVVEELIEPAILNTRRLYYLISSYLDLSQIQNGKSNILSLTKFNLKKCLRDCLKLVHLQAKGKGLNLLMNYSSSLPMNIVSDPNRISQVVINLIGNSMKFTNRGSIMIRAEESNKTGIIRIVVQDTGQGIKEEDKKKLFQEFGKIDYGNNPHGIGLGLVISNNLARLLSFDKHCGIEFKSEWGIGSEFFFKIKNCREEEALKKENNSMNGEEDVVCYSETENEFDSNPYKLMTNHLALEKTTHFKFLDNLMGNENEKDSFNINEDSEKESKGSEVFSEHLNYVNSRSRSPPGREADLVDSEPRPINNEARVNGSEKLSENKEKQGNCCAKILYVDDEPMNLKTFKIMVESLQIKAEFARTKMEAIAILKQRMAKPCKKCHLNKFKLIFMDCELDMNYSGIEFAREIINGAFMAPIKEQKIIACSGHTRESVMRKVVSNEIIDCLEKPFSKFDLAQIIKQHISSESD